MAEEEMIKTGKTLSAQVKFLLAAVVILAIILFAVVFDKSRIKGQPDFYAVYLRSGEIYFGQLQTFPNFGLRDVYMLQTNPQNQKTPYSLLPFADVFWGPNPKSLLEINKNDVVWIIKLSHTSPVYRAILSLSGNNLFGLPNQTIPTQPNIFSGSSTPAAR